MLQTHFNISAFYGGWGKGIFFEATFIFLGHILLYMPMKFDFVLSADLVA
jgi:hypothetical protein